MSSKKPIRLKPSDVLPKSQPAKNGLVESFSAKTIGQKNYIRTMVENDVTFVTGDPGTGKSFLAIGLACQYLMSGKCDTIIICRPSVEASPKGLGYLSGNLMEKLGPYVRPAMENIKKFISKEKFASLVEDEIIKFEALEYMRGSTFDKSFLILEEAQNCSFEQLKMCVTRIGFSTKMIINGDLDQSDLWNRDRMLDLEYMINKIEANQPEGFGVSRLTSLDIIRSPLISRFLNAIK